MAAYNGYLIKLGGSSGLVFPMKYIAHDSYKCTPDQRMESSANRSVTGVLRRQTVSHTATKIEFNTPVITNKDLATINLLLSTFMTDTLQRKTSLQYYDMTTDSYKTGTFYIPDVDYSIQFIDNVKNIVYYDPIRFAFIEY